MRGLGFSSTFILNVGNQLQLDRRGGLLSGICVHASRHHGGTVWRPEPHQAGDAQEAALDPLKNPDGTLMELMKPS